MYMAVISSNDQNVVIMPLAHTDNNQYIFTINASTKNTFTIETRRSGRTSIFVKLIRVSSGNTSWPGITVAMASYHVSVVRKPRMVDRAFNCAVAVMVVIGAFSLGCATDVALLWYSLRQPNALILALCCQFVVMPLVSL